MKVAAQNNNNNNNNNNIFSSDLFIDNNNNNNKLKNNNNNNNWLTSVHLSFDKHNNSLKVAFPSSSPILLKTEARDASRPDKTEFASKRLAILLQNQPHPRTGGCTCIW